MVESVEILFTDCLKKDGSINARVRKDNGSYIHFPIEETFITDHFNMYVNFIHFIQESSDVRFMKTPKVYRRENKRKNNGL